MNEDTQRRRVSLLLSLILFEALFVEGRVEGVEVPAVELICQQSQILAEALIVYYLSRSEKAYRVYHVGVVAVSQDVVIGRASLLLRREALVKVGYRVALARYRKGVEGYSRCRIGIDTGGVIDEVRVKARFLYIILAQILCELIHDSSYHLEVVQLLGTP